MLQREVVARMTAEPGTADYGRLTVMLQVKFAIRRLFVSQPGAFRPAPKVESAIARLIPLGAAKPLIVDLPLFARVCRCIRTPPQDAAQCTRRCATRRSGAWARPRPSRRNIAVGDFVRIANALAAAH
jgi:16S rRNA (adenine1518-N6/adenine1519-N6)-dimethyltransferase